MTYPTEVSAMSKVYSVPGVSCEHCRTAITREVAAVAGVRSVEVDLEGKTVTVEGEAVDDAVVAAIDEAGYDVAGVAAR
jgi:copper chaperone CopZ